MIAIASCSKKSNPKPLPPTSLELSIKDNVGNPISGATVELFSSENDLVDAAKNGVSTNVLSTGYSSSDGTVTFTNLSAIKYYFYAFHDCENNINGGVVTNNALIANTKNNFTCVLSGTGTLKFVNTSSNPYEIYVNGAVFYSSLSGGQTLIHQFATSGSYSIRVLQLSGYIVSPTDKTYTGTLNCGGALTTTFP